MKIISHLLKRAQVQIRSLHQAVTLGQEGSRRRLVGGNLAAGEEGQALVEMAVMFGFLLLPVVTGILIFGVYMAQVQSVTEGVSAAGSTLVTLAGLTNSEVPDPCASVSTAFLNAAPMVSSNTSMLAFTTTIAAKNHTGTSCQDAASDLFTAGGTPVTVTVTYTGCSLNIYGKNFNPAGCTITRSITEFAQ
jgi:Flp pilus assembly protein TadG